MPVETRTVQQAYRFAFDPTPRQERMFRSHAGAARFSYNWGNARIIEALDAREAEKAAVQSAAAAAAVRVTELEQLVADAAAEAAAEYTPPMTAAGDATIRLRNLQAQLAGAKADAAAVAGGKPETKVPGHFDLCKQWTAHKSTAVGCRCCRALLVNVTPDAAFQAGASWDTGTRSWIDSIYFTEAELADWNPRAGDWRSARDGTATCGDGSRHDPTSVSCGRCGTHLAQNASGAWLDGDEDTACPAANWEKAHDPASEFMAWVGENFVGTYQAALRDAAKAWSDFFKSAKGQRKGRRLGRPRFKKRGKARDSFQVHGSTLRIMSAGAGFRPKGADKGATRDMVVLPKIGPVFLHESARKLRRRTEKGTARIVRGTVARESDGRWYIALTAEVQREVRTGPSARQRKGGTAGVDFGVRELATLSDGTVIPNPRHLEADLGRLARAQRTVSRCEPGSGRRAKAVLRVGRLHARVKAERLDSLHKATSGLVHSYERIVVEGFDVQETARYRRRGKVDPKKKEKSGSVPGKVRTDRNRALADTGIGIARWQLQSKAAWYGCQVTATDKHAPTGRTCSACETVKAKPVPPADELFTCEACGQRMPRRLNTARVLAAVPVAPSTGETLNAPGGGVSPAAARGGRQSPVKGEASARPRPG